MNIKPLFNKEILRKYFDILYRLDRTCQSHYKGRDKLNPDKEPCQQDVFVQRTLRKWLSGKYYKIVDTTDTPKYAYIALGGVSFYYGYGEEIQIVIIRASGGFEVKKVSHNDLFKLEGVEITVEEWSKVAKLFLIPEDYESEYARFKRLRDEKLKKLIEEHNEMRRLGE